MMKKPEEVTPIVFRALLDWFICSDPWPVDKHISPQGVGEKDKFICDDENHRVIKEWLDSMALFYGYDNCIHAFHRHGKQEE